MNIYFHKYSITLLLGLKSNLRHETLCLKIWGATKTKVTNQRAAYFILQGEASSSSTNKKKKKKSAG
jgi:hypothetical protein